MAQDTNNTINGQKDEIHIPDYKSGVHTLNGFQVTYINGNPCFTEKEILRLGLLAKQFKVEKSRLEEIISGNKIDGPRRRGISEKELESTKGSKDYADRIYQALGENSNFKFKDYYEILLRNKEEADQLRSLGLDLSNCVIGKKGNLPIIGITGDNIKRLPISKGKVAELAKKISELSGQVIENYQEYEDRRKLKEHIISGGI